MRHAGAIQTDYSLLIISVCVCIKGRSDAILHDDAPSNCMLLSVARAQAICVCGVVECQVAVRAFLSPVPVINKP